MSNTTRIIIAVLAASIVGVAVVGLNDNEEPAANDNANNQNGANNQADSENTANSSDENDSEAVATTSVSIMSSNSDGFDPQVIKVKVGDTVTWTNNDSAPHVVEFDDEVSDNLSGSETFQKKFDTAGTFDYSCGIHSVMTGRVIVES